LTRVRLTGLTVSRGVGSSSWSNFIFKT
jgi:hypothetical protein